MKNQATNTLASNEKNLSEEEIVESLRSSTTCAYMFSPNHGDIDTSNLINIVKNDDKTILRHTVNIAGIPTDTSIRFEINHGKGGPRYNIFGHHNKLSYIRRTSDAEVALKHFASTVSEIVGYCFEPPASHSAIWP